MLEPGSDEAADLRILDSHVRRFQYHHPEPVHGIERRTTKASLHVRQKLCDFEFKFLAMLSAVYTGDNTNTLNVVAVASDGDLKRWEDFY